jgi:hypothetical protein
MPSLSDSPDRLSVSESLIWCLMPTLAQESAISVLLTNHLNAALVSHIIVPLAIVAKAIHYLTSGDIIYYKYDSTN